MYSATIKGAKRVITGNSLPLHNPTGTFPIPADDPSHEYDQNPNFIRMGPVRFELPVEPAAAAKPSCVGFGAIGILTDGSLLFNAVDARGRDAAAHEILDTCDGHPAPGGIYHHHTVPSCLLAAANGTSTLVGYAFDGFGIYVERDAAGVLPTNTDLDACHGRTSQVMWDGKPSVRYHYVATSTYPYTVGCFHGTPVVRPAPPPPAVGPAPPAVPPASGVPSPSAAR
jgi:hypothetical protein